MIKCSVGTEVELPSQDVLIHNIIMLLAYLVYVSKNNAVWIAEVSLTLTRV